MVAPRRRPVTPADEPFLLALTLDRRADELAGWGWPPPQARAFVESQHALQRRARLALPGLEEWVLALDGEPVGHLVLAGTGPSRRVVEVVVLRAYRGRGLAGAALKEVLTAADAGYQELRLQVEPGNPARRLYERLGFVAEGPDTLVGVELVRAPR